MRAINHALTGTGIALIIGKPELAIPIAFVSHYIGDVIPHYGSALGLESIKTKAFKNLIIIDAILCFLLELSLAIFRPDHWVLAGICAFAAASPDFLSFNRFDKMTSGKKFKPGLYSRFASKIQWFERPIGAVVELVWFVAAVAIILPFYINA